MPEPNAKCKLKYEGQIFPTNLHGNILILKYLDKNTVHVRFINTGYETVTRINEIKEGCIKDKLAPAVCGVGVVGEEPTKINGTPQKDYVLWHGMVSRCYSEKEFIRKPTYQGCTVSENFKYFPYFKRWCNEQIGYNSVDNKGKPFALDKDILIKGNKVYSEYTCCFVPQEVNNLFIKKHANRGEYPIGVYYHKTSGKFVSMISTNGSQRNLGFFNNQEDAFEAYKREKERYIKEVANKWKDKIDPRVYEALMKYQVEITD